MKKHCLLLLLFVMACGEVRQQPLDAFPPGDDAPPDAPDPTGPVKVTALTYAGDGQPELLTRLIFQDSDGNVVLEGPVDMMGKLEALLPTGGSVTSIRTLTDTPDQLDAELTTIVGVRPGDDLIVGLKPPPRLVNQGGLTTMTVGFTPFADATDHVFYTTCGQVLAGAVSPATLRFRDSCREDMFDVVLVASGGSVSPPRFIKLTDVAYENGGSFSFPGIYSIMTDFTVNVANMPGEATSLGVVRSSILDVTSVATQSVSIRPTAGNLSVVVPHPPGVGTRSEVALTISRTRDAYGIQQHAVHTATLGVSVAVDLGAQQLPWFATLGATPTGVAWTQRVAGERPDGMVVEWRGSWIANGRFTTIAWRIAQPVTEGGITLPRLPAAHARFDPQAQTVEVTPQSGAVALVDYDIITSYDAFRQQPDTLVTTFLSAMGAYVDVPYQRRMYTASAP
jgi:hypothetical protein